MPAPPGRVRAALRRHPRGVDAGLTAVFALACVVAMSTVSMSGAPLAVEISWGLLSVATAASVLFRRSAPHLTATLSCLTLLAALPGTFGSALGVVSLIIALSTAASHRSTRAVWSWTAVGTAAAALGTVPPVAGDASALVGAVLGYGTVFVIVALAGISAADRSRYTTALLERALQLARDRDQQAQLAASAERARIAREMHDIVAHSLTVVVALAEGARSATDDNPEQAKEAMAHVARIGRASSADMRRVLGVLLDASSAEPEVGAPAGPLVPQPSLAELEALVHSYRAAGLPVVLTVSGTAPESAAVQLALFRVVQEALTNALRHSRSPSRVEVLIGCSDPFGVEVTGVEVTVVDDGRRSRTERSATETIGSGRGLLGMRERLSLFGGTVEAGPVAPHGWKVHAFLPLVRSEDAA